jgi:hypothetical protein
MPAISTPVAPAPMTTKVSQAARFAGSLSLSARSKASRIRRVRRPVVVAEVAVASAGGQNQPVVAERLAVLQDHLACREIHALRLAVEHRGVLLAGEDAPDRLGDRGGGESRGRDLVKERLEQVVVGAVHDGDLDRRPAQCSGGKQPAEAATEDEYTGGHGRYRL